ncbi:MAG: tripartite tricarboxylate transporter substrate binding protein [Rubrivivax sp.]|nr:tripartite tricarboxylate transporter substrate binding protein [Rubrivivax sp.]
MTHPLRRRTLLAAGLLGSSTLASAQTPPRPAASRPAGTPAPARAGAAPAAAAAAAAPRVAPAAAGAWPTQTVKILVGFPAGSTPDLSARILAEALAKPLGQSVVVENRPGASGNIAADLVAKARDDHTLGVVINGNLTSARMLNPKLPFDPAKDFTLLSLLTTAPLALVTQASQPAGAEFFTAARDAGKKWNYGSVGIGSVGHLGLEYLKSKAGRFEAVHVPYNGNPAVITALIQGDVQMALMPPGIALPQIRAGKLRAIGLTGGRSTLAPEIPSLQSLGVPLYDLEVWTALVGPASLSAAAQARLAAEVPAQVRSAEVRQRLFNAGWQAQGSAPEGLKLRVKSETAVMGGIIAMQGITAQ